jgi:putative ABC transport system permease protein
LSEQVGESLLAERMVTVLCGLFAALALTLASVGLYGTLSSSVARRTSEIGVRMALGARTADVVWMIVREGLALACAGLAVGLAGGMALSGAASKLLFGVAPGDPWTYAAVAAILAAASGVASYLPARRAARLDPMITLRCE